MFALRAGSLRPDHSAPSFVNQIVRFPVVLARGAKGASMSLEGEQAPRPVPVLHVSLEPIIMLPGTRQNSMRQNSTRQSGRRLCSRNKRAEFGTWGVLIPAGFLTHQRRVRGRDGRMPHHLPSATTKEGARRASHPLHPAEKSPASGG